MIMIVAIMAMDKVSCDKNSYPKFALSQLQFMLISAKFKKMTNVAEIEEELTNILNKAAKILNLNKFSLELNLNAQKGDGFLADFYKVSILDEETNRKIPLALKKAPIEKIRREESSIDLVFKNEIYFYSVVFPTLKKFEQEHQVSIPFDSIPDYVTSIGDINKEIIVLKDITVDGFKLWQKDLSLDDEHAKFIFATYGRFHALSFCFKDQKPEEYKQLIKPMLNLLEDNLQKPNFCDFLSRLVKRATEAFDPQKDAVILEKFKKYIDNAPRMFSESLRYDGEHSGILHGDCWSNNMMFKYQQLEDRSILKAMKLLDFQIIFEGTPVYDLSYFFYSGGSKELFDRLEDYLDIYHENFSKIAEELGSDPNKLLPRKILTEEWKKFCKFGMLLSLILIKIKLMSKEDSVELIEHANNKSGADKFFELNCNEDLFDKRVQDILIHMYEINAL